MQRTKRAMSKLIVLRAGTRDVDLLRTAAGRKEISMSEFIRVALREKAARVLLDSPTAESAA